MKRTFIEDLKSFEISKKVQFRIFAGDTKFDGDVNTDGDEDCLPPIDDKTKTRKENGVCVE
ncbi:hypothetical protein [Tenacibaculum sp. 190524A05c]|uniref:hypothetical protein n=1 Tax=Tenacibaculum platacis TaxID=3137852 RepID=UPI0032B12B11